MRGHYEEPPQTYLNFLRFSPSCLLLDVSLFSPNIKFSLSLFFYSIFVFCYYFLSDTLQKISLCHELQMYCLNWSI